MLIAGFILGCIIILLGMVSVLIGIVIVKSSIWVLSLGYKKKE